MQTVAGVCGELEELLEEEPAFEGREELLEFYFQIRDFSMIYELTDDCYRIYSQIREDGSFMVRLFCVDPSGNLAAFLEQGNSAVFFSATLLPVNYYKELLTSEATIRSRFSLGKGEWAYTAYSWRSPLSSSL